MHVFINPGHAPNGMPDSGAVNRELGLRECDIALDVCRQVKSFLEFAGCSVTLIQSHNLAGEEKEGINICGTANNLKCDIFVSIHCNSSEHSTARGAETLYYSADSKGGKLAGFIQSQLVRAVRRVDAAFPDRGIKERRDLIVLNSTIMPAALVEIGFISNGEDAAIMLMYGHEIAAAIARGITDYWQAVM